jgi:hypothetical protein
MAPCVASRFSIRSCGGKRPGNTVLP